MLSKKVLSAEGTSGTESPRSVFRLHRGRSRAQLFQFRARYEEREHAVAVLRTNAIRVDLDRDRDCAVEYASDAFPAMDAGIFLVFDLLLAGDTYRVFLGFDGQVPFGDARQFNHQDKVPRRAETRQNVTFQLRNQDRMAGRMKIKVVKMDDRTFGVAINGEVFEVNDGCTMLGEAGSLMRSLNSKIMEAAAKARRARELRQPPALAG